MKKLIILFLIVLLSACHKKTAYQNPYLENVKFSIQINLDLPEYSALKFANNSVLVRNAGIKGVLVFNSGNGFLAYEASDPNHYPSSCSTMQPNQFTCSCSCEDNTYSLYTGQLTKGTGQYSLKPYHIAQNNQTLSISN